MKFKQIFILMGMLCFLLKTYAQQNLAQIITISYQQQRLSYVLADLNKKHKLNFSYSNNDIALDKRISINLKKQTLSTALNEIAEKANVSWQQIGNQIILKPKGKASETKVVSPEISQTIRGVVFDRESNIPLPGVSVKIISLDPAKTSNTNSEGEFRFRAIPMGRHDIELKAIGYKPLTLSQVLVGSGKEVVLNLAMSESVTDLNAVTITARKDSQKPMNDMASTSARSFTVEETSRYAGSMFDPARMAQSFAGVTAGNGINNDIVVRGNSSKGLQWRLEGVEIINPNHFGEEGSSAGGISMISSGILSNSDFFTGAFPAEYGNALSGVFDLQFRKGNTEQKEYAFMVGLMGTEASLEGPFKKGGNSSYLINYRYSTLGILEKLGISPLENGKIPIYQDLAFNLNFPTKNLGTFSLFGIGGISSQNQEAERDLTKWETLDDRSDRKFGYNSGSGGLKHVLPINDKVYLKNILSYSGSKITDDSDTLSNTYEKSLFLRDNYSNSAIRYSGLINYKANAKNTLRSGVVLSFLQYNLNSLSFRREINRLVNVLNAKGDAQNIEAYAQIKHQVNNAVTLNAGLHGSYFNLSDSYSIEPRAGLNWWIRPNQQISFGAGVHSRLEPMAFYFAKNELEDGTTFSSNSSLAPSKALHLVAGYERSFINGLKFKAEAYYQHLFNVPVSSDPAYNFTALNTADAYLVYSPNYRPLVNKGTGKNAGLELTLERSLNNGYYFLITSSLFDSKFKNIEKREFSTDYNSNYVGNFLSGKEWKAGRTDKNLFGINTKVVYTGGRRFTPVDLQKSLERDSHYVYEDQINTLQTSPYFRLDLSLSYRINKPDFSHALFIDVQNVMNRQNELGQYYNSEKNKIETATLAGMIPSVNYRIEF